MAMISKRAGKQSRVSGIIEGVKTVKDMMPFGYSNIDITSKDVYECAKTFPELKVKTCVAPDCLKDVRTKIRLLCLSGTIPVNVQNNKYNIPISIYMKHSHPHHPPYCLVAPTNDMTIQPSRYVDSQGLVDLPYLHNWKPNNSSLTDLVNKLVTTFEKQCPLYSLSAVLQVHVQVFDREKSVKNITFMTVRSSTVKDLKIMIQDKIETAGVLPEHQALIYRGVVLEDSCKISDYHVQNEVTLQSVINSVLPHTLCPLIPVIATREGLLKKQLLAELQDHRATEHHHDVTRTQQDTMGEKELVTPQDRLVVVKKELATLQQQLDAERKTSEMLKAKCQYLEDLVIDNLTKRLEALENRTTKT